MTYTCFSKQTKIGSDSGLSTNAGILLIEPLETNFNETLIEIYTSS